jgi:hypothetical protein
MQDRMVQVVEGLVVLELLLDFLYLLEYIQLLWGVVVMVQLQQQVLDLTDRIQHFHLSLQLVEVVEELM